jgi:hypothetical protein
MKTKLICILAMACLFVCEENQTQIDKSVNIEDISIDFVTKTETDSDSLDGLFQITNNGDSVVNVGLIFDTKPARCGFPVFEKLVDEKWEKVHATYEGGVIFSSLQPKQNVVFEASLKQIQKYKGENLRLLVASPEGFYFRSRPFVLTETQ